MLINDPVIAHKLYADPATLNRFEPFLESVSNTITFLNGKEWGERRKNVHSNLITTINSSQITKGSLSFLQSVVFPHLDAQQSIDDILPILRPITLNLVLFACVGTHIQSLDDPFFVAFDALASAFWRNLRARMFIAFLIGNGRLYRLFFRRFFNLSALGEAIRRKMVDLVKDYEAKNKGSRSKKCFVEHVRDTRCLSEGEMFSDVASLLFPSIDTTANMLGFCICVLCKYPRSVQEMLFAKELRPIFGGKVENIALSQDVLQKLPRFRAFVHDVLRMYPTTPVSAVRYTDKASPPVEFTTADGESYEVNGNTKFCINTIGIGRNPQHWVKDASVDLETVDMTEVHFEFWLNAEGKFKYNAALTTFSLGGRQCVGKRVAINNLYVVLAALMIRYKFSVEDYDIWKIPVHMGALFSPGKTTINIERRK